MINNISLENELIILSTSTIIKLFTYKNWNDLIALYLFYHKQCKIQWTNQSFTKSNFAMKWLWWGDDRFKSAKKILKELWLIEDIQHRDEKWKILWWFVKLNYIKSDNKANLSTGAEIHPLATSTHWLPEDKCLKINNINTYDYKLKYNILKKIILNNLINNISSSCKEEVKKNKTKRNEEESTDSDETFEKLWKWYSSVNIKKQKAKAKTKEYFNKLIKTSKDLELLRYALPRYVESTNDKNYLVLLRTYLSDKLYLDYEDEFNNLSKEETQEIKQEENIEINHELKFKRSYDD